MSWLKTLRMTVNCPYCGCGFTFKNETAFQAHKANPTVPLHPACKKALQAEQQKLQQKESP